MTKIDIFSGFLGAGKTTLIKKLIKEAYAGEKLVLIENEFGEIGIDGGFLKDAGIEITEMNSGCICCSLVGDFTKALGQVLEQFAPDRILIEPSGVGKLSDVIRAVQGVTNENVVLGGFTTVVDANKCKMYLKNFGEFFGDQLEHASTIILSHTDNISETKLAQTVALIRERNSDATLVTTPWSSLTGEQILAAVEKRNSIDDILAKLTVETENHHHHHEHHHEHEHHEHHYDHHEHGDDCSCSCCCGHDHGHHHADDIFVSWGSETTKKYTVDEMRAILDALLSETDYGTVLRAKGIVAAKDGSWLHFDYVPGEADIRVGCADVIGRLCVIGAGLKQDKLVELFGV